MDKRKVRATKMTSEQAQVVLNFFNTAYKDYIAARQLLLANHLIQGCILANTAIEKYFKGMKAILGEPIPRHHDITVNKFQKTLENKFKRLYDKLNFDFLKLLSLSYELRYFDELEPKTSLLISNRKTLAELDYTVSEIESSFQFNSQRPGVAKRGYDVDRDSGNQSLWESNYVLTEATKKDFIETVNHVYEFRKMENSEILEITYSSEEIIDDSKFIYDAIRPNSEDPGKKFTLCFTPIN